MTDRTTARVVGGLFITATVAGVLANAFQQPGLGADDYLTKASLDKSQVATGVLFELIMGIAVVGIAIAIYPVLRRFSERLALGYVVARTIEVLMYAISVIGGLTLLTLSREFVDAGAPQASPHQALGGLLQAERDWGNWAVLVVVFALSALILNFTLYRARLVPRWLSVWGLIGAASYLVSGVMVMYGLDAGSTTQVASEIPLGVQEMALAVWLIVKGFTAPAPGGQEIAELVAAQPGYRVRSS